MSEIVRRPGVINLAPGQPNFPSPEHVVQAGIDALQAGHTKYTHHAGILQLRTELCRKLNDFNQIDVAPDQIVVTHGAMGALYSSFVALLDPGDEVLLPDPGWPNFKMMAVLSAATIREYKLTRENGYLPEVEHLKKLVSRRTRLLLINSPLNPIGATIPATLMAEILDFARAHDLWIVSDEAYEAITYGNQHVSAAALDPSGRVVSVFSFSKTYSMTGWRIGYAVAPPALAEVIANLQEAIISCASAPAQWAALAALTGPQDIVDHMNREYATRIQKARAILDENGVDSYDPGGAFYLWIDIRNSNTPSAEFCRSLLDQHQVAVVPGSAFGPSGEGYVRASMASAESDVTTGMALLARHVSELTDRPTPDLVATP
ncbi:MAG TPA: aminotransferase class I/II-fold pyridoxal phosphate-dependent enzyme [Acidimicrobiia bacterium]|nr:aminotransferase class I/II-fold pyridoxal phosphate-dependent enzyme [Acidimicrobiia bacterium]